MSNFLKLFGILMVASVIFMACDNGTSGGGGTGLPNLPSMTYGKDGKISDELYPDDQYDNEPVTEENLREVMTAFSSSMSQRSASQRSRTRESNKQQRETWREDTSFTEIIPSLYGDGYMNFTASWNYKETWNDKYEEYSDRGTVKIGAFDFSYNGKLFIGGVIAGSYSDYEYEDDNRYEFSFQAKSNGKIEFRGTYSGSLEYNNVFYKNTYDSRKDRAAIEEYSGKVVVKSKGKTVKEFNLSNPSDLEEFEELSYIFEKLLDIFELF